ncbi:DUF5085 family protein [Ruminococcus albus]|uniref:DUF5085 family protein n=1 Tax=Ruminococcus albus TaxID=1264 RepID=UPI001FA936C6|nr:DUF5085 family protein [Ruminococcus albus]
MKQLQYIPHLNIYAENLITYSANIKKADILKVIQHIHDNLSALGLSATGRFIFTFKDNNISDETQSAEIYIPVKGEIKPSENYGSKLIFRLINAVMTRHEGSIADISRTETALKDYIKKNNFEPITNAYYVVIRNGDSFGSDCVFEVYIGTNYNSL